MMNLPGGISIGDSTGKARDKGLGPPPKAQDKMKLPSGWEKGAPTGKYGQPGSHWEQTPKLPSKTESRGAPRAEPPGLKGLLGKLGKVGTTKKIARGSYKRG
jgi:hypothetical protein